MVQNILDKWRNQIHFVFMALVIAFIFATPLVIELKALAAAVPTWYMFYCYMEMTAFLREEKTNAALHQRNKETYIDNTETYTNEYGEKWQA